MVCRERGIPPMAVTVFFLGIEIDGVAKAHSAHHDTFPATCQTWNCLGPCVD